MFYKKHLSDISMIHHRCTFWLMCALWLCGLIMCGPVAHAAERPDGQSRHNDRVAFTSPVREVVVTNRDKDWKKALKKVHKQLSACRKISPQDTLFYGEAQYLSEVFCHGHPIQSCRDYGFYMAYHTQVEPRRGRLCFIPVFNAHSYRFDALGQDTIPASPHYFEREAKYIKSPPSDYESDNDMILFFGFINALRIYGPCFCKKLDDYTFSLRQFDGQYYTIEFKRDNASGILTIDSRGPSLYAMRIQSQFAFRYHSYSAPSEAEIIFTPQGFVKEATYIHRWRRPYIISEPDAIADHIENIYHPRPDADQNPCEIRIWWKIYSTQGITNQKVRALPVLQRHIPPLHLPDYLTRYDDRTMLSTRFHAALFDTLPSLDPDFAAVEAHLGRNINIQEQYANSVTPYWRTLWIFTHPTFPAKNLGDKLYFDMLEKYNDKYSAL